MTVETRCTIQVSDIVGAEFECECGTRTSTMLRKIQDHKNFACGNCGKPFLSQGSDGMAVWELLVSVGDVSYRQRQQKEFKPSVRLILSGGVAQEK